MIPVAVIGSGMAGLACARALADAGHAPVVFDKGRGIGGRLATRRVDGLQFDHGAQYVTAKGAGFAAVLDRMMAEGAAARWEDGAANHRVGVPGMSALAKALGAGLDIRQNAQVTGVVRDGAGWRLRVDDVDHLAARVIITVPAPQVAGLLGADHPLVAALGAVRLDPCLTLMAAARGPAPFVSRSDPDDPLAWIAQDSAKPGRPQDVTCWVAQASIAFSMPHLEEDAPAIAARMLPFLCDRLGVAADDVTYAAAHRWRYARVAVPLGQPFLRSDDATLYLGGDWCIGPRVEAAWTSGTAIATDVMSR